MVPSLNLILYLPSVLSLFVHTVNGRFSKFYEHYEKFI